MPLSLQNFEKKLTLPEWFIVPSIGKTHVENSSIASASKIILMNTKTIVLENFIFKMDGNDSYHFYVSKKQGNKQHEKMRYQIPDEQQK